LTITELFSRIEQVKLIVQIPTSKVLLLPSLGFQHT